MTLTHAITLTSSTVTNSGNPDNESNQPRRNHVPEFIGFRLESSGTSIETSFPSSSHGIQETAAGASGSRSERVPSSQSGSSTSRNQTAVRYVRRGSSYCPDTSDTYLQPVQDAAHRSPSPETGHRNLPPLCLASAATLESPPGSVNFCHERPRLAPVERESEEHVYESPE